MARCKAFAPTSLSATTVTHTRQAIQACRPEILLACWHLRVGSLTASSINTTQEPVPALQALHVFTVIPAIDAADAFRVASVSGALFHRLMRYGACSVRFDLSHPTLLRTREAGLML